jgi:hypothetical protein
MTGANDVLRWKAVGGALTTLPEEVEEQTVEGTGCLAILHGDPVIWLGAGPALDRLACGIPG